MAAWLSSFSLAALAVVAAITAMLGWRRASLFRESFYSLSVELTSAKIWSDDSWTLMVLTARLRNTSQVLVRLQSVEWSMGMMGPEDTETQEYPLFPKDEVLYEDFYLEPNEDDIIFREVWLPKPEKSQPVYAQVLVTCPDYKGTYPRGWTRRVHFILEDSNG